MAAANLSKKGDILLTAECILNDTFNATGYIFDMDIGPICLEKPHILIVERYRRINVTVSPQWSVQEISELIENIKRLLVDKPENVDLQYEKHLRTMMQLDKIRDIMNHDPSRLDKFDESEET